MAPFVTVDMTCIFMRHVYTHTRTHSHMHTQSLRDSLWKAKDEVAVSTKAWEDKMKEASYAAEVTLFFS